MSLSPGIWQTIQNLEPQLLVGAPGFAEISQLDHRCPTQDFMAYKPEELCQADLAQKMRVTLPESTQNTLFCVSLSGGVDSVSHLVILDALRAQLDFRLTALFLEYGGDSEGDLLKFMSSRISCPIYRVKVPWNRPRNECHAELTREQFENATRELRFAMYKRVLAIEDPQNSLVHRVVVGHHLDDLDENILSELGKSNIFNVSGMSTLSTIDEVPIFRPLLYSARKSEILEFARQFRLIFMRDSTPYWSKRGWIRRVLDQFGYPEFHTQLTQLAHLSNQVVSQMVATFVEVNLLNHPVWVKTLEGAPPSEDGLPLLMNQAQALGDLWNQMVDQYQSQVFAKGLHLIEASKIQEAGSHLTDLQGVSSPIQGVKLGSLEAHRFLQEVQETGLPKLRKKAILECLSLLDKPEARGTLSQDLNYMVGGSPKKLVLYPASLRVSHLRQALKQM